MSTLALALFVLGKNIGDFFFILLDQKIHNIIDIYIKEVAYESGYQ